jgi:hypothetical protein
MSTEELRYIVPPSKCMIVLDTNIARQLGESAVPPAWLNTFVDMARAGEYSFSLADGSFAELMNQRVKVNGGMSNPRFAQMIDTLQTFINLEFPIVLGGRDILGMLGAGPELWSPAEVRRKAQSAWSSLSQEPTSHEAEDIAVRLDKVLEEARSAWKAQFNNFSAHYEEHVLVPARERAAAIAESQGINPRLAEELSQTVLLHELSGKGLDAALKALDEKSSIRGIPMSQRCDLQMRYAWRQWVRTMKLVEPYDPASRKKRNDGIDYDLYRFLMLPALVVTEDKAFLAGIREIPSIQTHWFMTPQALADSWMDGNRPWPVWR